MAKGFGREEAGGAGTKDPSGGRTYQKKRKESK